MSMLACRVLVLSALIALPIVAHPTLAAAQEVVGVVRSLSGERLPDVVVSIASGLQTARTDRSGLFHLSILPGSHELVARRIGFESAKISLDIGTASVVDTVRIVLSPTPTELNGLVVRGERGGGMELTLSSETLRNAPPLGESDVIRSLPLLPAISQPNDMLGVIHLAGGASDEANITIGGYPLQAPFHVGNVFGAFNVAALDRATVRMHHIPARNDGYLSGEIALEPKRTSDRATREIDVSLLSASATLTQPIGSRFGLLASGRSTYIDRLVNSLHRNGASNNLDIPEFQDVLVQLTGDGRKAWTWDLLAYGMRDAGKQSRQQSGVRPVNMTEGLLGVHAGYANAAWNTDVRFSLNNNRVSSADRAESDGRFVVRENLIMQQWITSEADIRYTRNRVQIRGGVLARTRSHRFRWSPNFVNLAINTPVPASIDTELTQSRVGASAEGSMALSPSITLSIGSHLSLLNNAYYPSPRVYLDWKPAPRLTFNMAFNRRYQFDAVAGSPREVSVAQPVFFLERPRRADVSALSVAWEAPKLPGFANARFNWSIYDKRYRDRTLAELPTEGDSYAASANDSQNSPLFSRGSGYARGISVSAELSTSKRLALYGTYTGERVREVSRGIERPSAWDIPRQLSLFASLSLTERLSLNYVFQAHSGPATSPVLYRVIVPLYQGYAQRYVYGEPNGGRFPGYQRTDASLAYAWHARRADWKISLQVINLFDRHNGLDYNLSTYFECVEFQSTCVNNGASLRSLPAIPSLSFSVRW